MMQIHGNDDREGLNNMAENILALASEEGPKPGPGRPEGIENGRLWNTRDGLVFLLETTWPDVGQKLPKIKKPGDVYDALRVWEQHDRHKQQYVTEILLRSSSSPATGKSLSEKRRQLGTFTKSARSSYEHLEKCCTSFETAMRIDTSQYSESEREVIDEKIKERAEVLAHAGAEYLALLNRQQEMERSMKDCEAHFARTEFAQFCKSERYRKTPLNTANALAGLPYIGWRQSTKRCQKEACPATNGGSMQEFNTILRIIQSCTRKLELVKHAEHWLKSHGPNQSYGISDLQEHWYYLRWSIKTVLDAGTRSRDLPFAITREYWRRKYHPSNVDRLFAEEERIVF
jgi:hypothetical protein